MSRFFLLLLAIKMKPKVEAVLYYRCCWALACVRQTYTPLDEVPGLLYGGVVARVTMQYFADDLGCFIVQL